MAIVLENRKKLGRVDQVGATLAMRTPTLLATYRFRYMPGLPALGDVIPETAPVLDEVPYSWIAADGLLRMLKDDGSVVVSGQARGDPGRAGTLWRSELFTSGKCDSGGLASVVFSPAFAAPPVVTPVPTFPTLAGIGEVMIMPEVLTVTKSGATLKLRRSQGTLLVSGGTMVAAPVNTTGTVKAEGTPL